MVYLEVAGNAGGLGFPLQRLTPLHSYARRHDIRRHAPWARRVSQFDRILVAILRLSWNATRYGREVDFKIET